MTDFDHIEIETNPDTELKCDQFGRPIHTASSEHENEFESKSESDGQMDMKMDMNVDIDIEDVDVPADVGVTVQSPLRETDEVQHSLMSEPLGIAHIPLPAKTPADSLPGGGSSGMGLITDQSNDANMMDTNSDGIHNSTTTTTSATANSTTTLGEKWAHELQRLAATGKLKITERTGTQMEILKRIEARCHVLTNIKINRATIVQSHPEDKRGPHKVITTETTVFPRMIAFEQPLCKAIFNTTDCITTPDLLDNLAKQVYEKSQHLKFKHISEWFDSFNMKMSKPLDPRLKERAVHLAETLGCDVKESQELLARVNLYSVNMWHATAPHSMGRAIYPILSMLNHSCEPNTGCLFQPNGTVAIYATQSIGRGKEMTVSYSRDLLTKPKGFKINDMQGLASFQCVCKICRKPGQSVGPLNGLSMKKANGIAFETSFNSRSAVVYNEFKKSNYFDAGIAIAVMFKELNGLCSAFMHLDGLATKHMKANAKKEAEAGIVHTEPRVYDEPQAPPLFKARDRAIDQFLPLLACCIMNMNCKHTNILSLEHHASTTTTPDSISQIKDDSIPIMNAIEAVTNQLQEKCNISSTTSSPESKQTLPTRDKTASEPNHKPIPEVEQECEMQESHEDSLQSCHWSQETMLMMLEIFMARDYNFADGYNSLDQIKITNGLMLLFYNYLILGYSRKAMEQLPVFRRRKIKSANSEIIRRFKNWSLSVHHFSVLTFSTPSGLKSPTMSKLLHFASVMAECDGKKSVLLGNAYYDDLKLDTIKPTASAASGSLLSITNGNAATPLAITQLYEDGSNDEVTPASIFANAARMEQYSADFKQQVAESLSKF